MALHNLKITVYDGGGGTGKSGGGTGIGETVGEKKSKGKNTLLYKALNYNQTIKNKIQQATSPTTFFAIQSGVNLATQTARQFINYYVSDIGRSNGDSNYQAIVNRQIEQVTDTLGIFGGALSGATAGSVAGIPGAIIGAVVGAASSGVSMGFKYAERGRAYQHEMFTEASSQAYNLARAGNTALTGRLR